VRTTTAVVVWRHEGRSILVTFENDRVILTKASPAVRDDPFAAFDEWA